MTHSTLTATLGLSDRTRAILAHIRRYGSITPLEAQTVYKEWRLAARIHELREAGVDIITTMRRDAKGTRYARYKMTDVSAKKAA